MSWDPYPPPAPPPRGDFPKPEHLRGLPAYADASDEELQAIIDGATYLQVPPDWAVIWEGTPADKAYLVLTGELSVRHGAEEIAVISAGDFIGEMAIVQHKLRSATVVTKTGVTGLHFTAEAVESLRGSNAPFRAAIDAANAAHSTDG
jgi:CRP/FNR family cyclic AMP-dependent transcriptional regulator